MALEDLVEYEREIQVGGEPIRVSPLRVRQIPGFTRALGPAASCLMAGDLISAVSLYGDGLIEAIAIATGKSVEWIGELDGEEFVRLAAEVVEVNADFFVRRVKPALLGIEEKTKALTT